MTDIDKARALIEQFPPPWDVVLAGIMAATIYDADGELIADAAGTKRAQLAALGVTLLPHALNLREASDWSGVPTVDDGLQRLNDALKAFDNALREALKDD